MPTPTRGRSRGRRTDNGHNRDANKPGSGATTTPLTPRRRSRLADSPSRTPANTSSSACNSDEISAAPRWNGFRRRRGRTRRSEHCSATNLRRVVTQIWRETKGAHYAFRNMFGANPACWPDAEARGARAERKVDGVGGRLKVIDKISTIYSHLGLRISRHFSDHRWRNDCPTIRQEERNMHSLRCGSICFTN
jgi:hypothetical protein